MTDDMSGTRRAAFDTSSARGQTAGAALMVRPAAFGWNAETYDSNRFQARSAPDDPGLALAALAEFDGLVAALRGAEREHDGLALDRPPFELFERDRPVEVVAGPRIGITRAAELPWRYVEAGSRFVSR